MSTSSGWLIAKATARANESAGIAYCSPLTVTVGDRSYEASAVLEISDAAQAGLVLFYNQRCFCGIGFSTQQMFTYNYGEEQSWMRQNLATKLPGPNTPGRWRSPDFTTMSLADS